MTLSINNKEYEITNGARKILSNFYGEYDNDAQTQLHFIIEMELNDNNTTEITVNIINNSINIFEENNNNNKKKRKNNIKKIYLFVKNIIKNIIDYNVQQFKKFINWIKPNDNIIAFLIPLFIGIIAIIIAILIEYQEWFRTPLDTVNGFTFGDNKKEIKKKLNDKTYVVGKLNKLSKEYNIGVIKTTEFDNILEDSDIFLVLDTIKRENIQINTIILYTYADILYSIAIFSSDKDLEKIMKYYEEEYYFSWSCCSTLKNDYTEVEKEHGYLIIRDNRKINKCIEIMNNKLKDDLSGF